MSRRHQSCRRKGGRCSCCSRSLGNGKDAKWRQWLKLGITSRASNRPLDA